MRRLLCAIIIGLCLSATVASEDTPAPLSTSELITADEPLSGIGQVLASDRETYLLRIIDDVACYYVPADDISQRLHARLKSTDELFVLASGAVQTGEDIHVLQLHDYRVLFFGSGTLIVKDLDNYRKPLLPLELEVVDYEEVEGRDVPQYFQLIDNVSAQELLKAASEDKKKKLVVAVWADLNTPLDPPTLTILQYKILYKEPR